MKLMNMLLGDPSLKILFIFIRLKKQHILFNFALQSLLSCLTSLFIKTFVYHHLTFSILTQATLVTPDTFFEDQLAFNLVVLNFLSYLRLFKTSGLLKLSYLTFVFQMTNFILLFSKGPFSLLSFSLMMGRLQKLSIQLGQMTHER